MKQRNEWKTSSGWKITPKLEPDPIYAEYVKRMAEEQRKLCPPKPRPVKPEGMSEADFIFSLQQPSTQDIITKQKDPNYQRDWAAPLPDGWLANPEATTRDELVGARDVSLEEMEIEERRRRRPKNSLGQSDWETPKETKDRAIDHFRSHPSISEKDLSDAELLAVKEMKPPVVGKIVSIPYVDKEIPWWKAFAHWIRGGKVWTEKK